MSLLDVQNLRVTFGPATVVDDVSFSIAPGEKFALVGESGSGKTVTSLSVLRLNQDARYGGRLLFEGDDLLKRSEAAMRTVRGKDVSMIFQEPMTALNPLFTIGNQVGEVLATRRGVPAAEVEARAVELLRSVHLTMPQARLKQYPHELSGGMRQRVLVAMASGIAPKLLIADEPTTALDATIQEEVLVLFREIRDRQGTAIVIVTHDLGVIRRICDRVMIMYAGRIVEEGPTEAIFTAPRHPYTAALLSANPEPDPDKVHQRISLPADVPSLLARPKGCEFHTRCPLARPRCSTEAPLPVVVGDGRLTCHFPLNT